MTTIGYAGFGGASNGDFDRARRRSFARRILVWSGVERGRLLPFEEAAGESTRGVYRGREAVETAKIVGSVGRARDFDPAFMPITPALKERWRSVNRAFLQAGTLPPVRLNKVGDAYFVVDGNHRVSVARFHRAHWVDAEVTEFCAPKSAEQTTDERRETTCR